MALATSCSKEKENANDEPRQLYFASGFGLADAEIIVNGNPTNSGKAFTHFVISGQNKVQIKGVVGEGGYTFRLGKSSGLLASDYRDVLVHEEIKSGFTEDRTFSFKETTWPRWTWQDADRIESFGEKDLAEIKGIIREVFEAAKKLDLDQGLPVKKWTNDPVQLARTKELWDKAMAGVKSYDKLIYKVSPENELTALAGRQLVLIRTKSGDPIFYVGRDEDSIPEPVPGGPMVWNYFIGPDEMFFAKFNGKWSWLMPTL
ncbi:MAG: hypothetical protein ABW223_08300 [Rariglobus sp.]